MNIINKAFKSLSINTCNLNRLFGLWQPQLHDVYMVNMTEILNFFELTNQTIAELYKQLNSHPVKHLHGLFRSRLIFLQIFLSVNCTFGKAIKNIPAKAPSPNLESMQKQADDALWWGGFLSVLGWKDEDTDVRKRPYFEEDERRTSERCLWLPTLKVIAINHSCTLLIFLYS